MTGWSAVRHPVRTHPFAADVLLAVALFALSLAASHDSHEGQGYTVTYASVAVGVFTCAVISQRRRWPLPVLAVTTVGAVLASVVIGARTPYLPVVAVAAYTVAVNSERLLSWIAGLCAAAVMVGAAVVFVPGPWTSPQNLVFATLVIMATAIGDALRSRRAYVASIEERALRAEQTRADEAARQVAQERLRIARELHDIVAHHIAVINVQAGVAGHLLRTQPEAADTALGHVREAGRMVLDELSALLGVLRRSGDDDAPAEPAPGLHRLDALVDSFVQAGLRLDVTVSGRERATSSAVDLAAYRIIQESLTNAHKHGDGTATLRIEHCPQALRIEVCNRGGAPAAAPISTGHGLIGMRERAESVSGTLQAGGLPDGAFGVRAVLPRPDPAQ